MTTPTPYKRENGNRKPPRPVPLLGAHAKKARLGPPDWLRPDFVQTEWAKIRNAEEAAWRKHLEENPMPPSDPGTCRYPWWDGLDWDAEDHTDDAGKVTTGGPGYRCSLSEGHEPTDFRHVALARDGSMIAPHPKDKDKTNDDHVDAELDQSDS